MTSGGARPNLARAKQLARSLLDRAAEPYVAESVRRGGLRRHGQHNK